MSDEKVVALATKRGVTGGEPPDVNQNAIDLLEQMLKHARAGDITAVAIAAVTNDESTVTCMSSTDNFSLLIGGVAILQHRCLTKHV